MNWQQLDREYIAGTYQRMNFVPDRAEGCYLESDGKRYLDLFSGLAVNVLGHRHPAIIHALQGQLEQFIHISNWFYNRPAIALAERLVRYTVPGKVFFANSGAESTEAAIKAISKYGAQFGKKGVVVVRRSFHGRTTGALKLTRQESVRRSFPVIDYPVYEVELNALDRVAEAMAQNPAALLLEPVLGSGGLEVATGEYLRGCQQLCRLNKALFCLDEIQTGMGRSGYLFAYQEFDLRPDVILFAKGVGGGLPLGGIVLAKPWDDLFDPGDHGSTFAPSPLSAAAGLATLDVLLQEGFLERVRETSQWLMEQLRSVKEEFPVVEEIRGRGFMLGIVLKAPPEKVARIQAALLERGILVNVTQKTIIRLLPPLIITRGELEEFLRSFRVVLAEEV